MTMAHVALVRFLEQGFPLQTVRDLPAHARPSTIEEIAHAPSPFAVEGLLDDFRRFATEASPKTRARVLETARVRICELRGVLP